MQIGRIELGQVPKPHHVENADGAIGRFDQSRIAKVLHRSIDVHGRESERVGKLLLRQRQFEARGIGRIACDPHSQLAEQMRETLPGGVPAKAERPLAEDRVFLKRDLHHGSRDAGVLRDERQEPVAGQRDDFRGAENVQPVV